MLERSDVEHPLWRKKVDKGLLRDGVTPIPSWLCSIWNIDELFGEALSKKDTNSIVSIEFKGTTYSGQIAKSTAGHSQRFRLFFGIELKSALSETFLTTYMRAIEGEITQDKNHRDIERSISFWEFLDIEFDAQRKHFIFTGHYTIQPQFPELSRRLINSAPLKAISAEILHKSAKRIHKQDWRPRGDYRSELGADNVIYMLIDTNNKLIYVGETANLIKRFDNGHPDIKNWNFYRFNVLPSSLLKYRLEIERMIIRDLASMLTNKQSVQNIVISEYRLANRKIDR
jgi:hypothetical protein